jgi:hypothetical protein
MPIVDGEVLYLLGLEVLRSAYSEGFEECEERVWRLVASRD